MRSSFDIGEFLEEKEFDIIGKTFKGGVRISSLLCYCDCACADIFPVCCGPEAEEVTGKFLYAVVEIMLDFINQTNDRDCRVLDFHHPSQITKADM